MDHAARFDLVAFGELVGDPSRAAMLVSLLDGLARPASELAAIAGVGAPTASAHLARLVGGALLVAERRGRHRYYRLANERVAEALETVARPSRPRAGPRDARHEALAAARTCYAHLAGKLGVAWFAALERGGLLRAEAGNLALAPGGVRRFEALGLARDGWPTGRGCLDWTERRNHLGGALGGLLTEHLFAMGWIERTRERRAVRVTTRGRKGLADFGVERDVLG